MRITLFAACLSVTIAARGGDPAIPALPADVILDRLTKADAERAASLAVYTQTRKYTLENRRFNKTGEIVVSMSYRAPGAKTFQVVSEQGSKLVNRRVLRKLVEAEADAAGGASRTETKITPANYDFQLVGTGTQQERPCYLLDVTPKIRNKYLIRGRVWIDAEDFAIVRIEGSPAKNPSIWTRKIHIVHEYRKFGPFWLAVVNRSSADALVFGKTQVNIEYYDIHINGAQSPADGRSGL